MCIGYMSTLVRIYTIYIIYNRCDCMRSHKLVKRIDNQAFTTIKIIYKIPCFMRLMRSHNLAYFRWFLEHKKSRLHIAVQTGFNAYSGNIKCVLCDRMKWYQNTLSLCSSFSQSSSSLIAVASSIAVGSRPSVRSGVQRIVCSSLQFSKRSTMPFSVSVATQPSCISLDGWRTNLSLLIV